MSIAEVLGMPVTRQPLVPPSPPRASEDTNFFGRLAAAFTPRAVATLVPLMLAATDETIAKLQAACGTPVDLREAMQRMTLEIAGRTMFSFEMSRHGPTLRDFVMED